LKGEAAENGQSIDCIVNTLKLVNALVEPWEDYPSALEGVQHRMRIRAHLTAQQIHEVRVRVRVRVRIRAHLTAQQIHEVSAMRREHSRKGGGGSNPSLNPNP